MKKDGLDERTRTSRGWTGVEDYLAALARRRTARHKREGRPRSRMDPEAPTNTIGTIPFIVMMLAFALLVVAIASLAWPSNDRVRQAPVIKEVGTAPPGWMERAEQDMKRSR